MGDIFDYILWRDIPIQEVKFNEIDSLILSRFSYFPLDGLIKDNEKVTIKECYNRYKKQGKQGDILIKADLKLFPALANSKRFGNLYVTNYVNKVDAKEEKQFSAVTVLLPEDNIYISYRGTDDTIVGWKEDLYMSFSTLVPSQQSAVDYLNKTKIGKKIIVGGHSKGGNLAVYAAVFCNKKIKKRIIDVYNFDGPGFNKVVIDKEEYNGMIKKIHNYIPQSSIIGRLLEHKGEVTIVKSTQTGIMQHDLYSWQLIGDKFIISELTNSSRFIDRTLTDWLQKVNVEQRKEFIDVLFDILNATEVKKFADLNTNKFTTAKTIIKTYKKLDVESKNAMNYALNMLVEVGKSNIFIKKGQKNKDVRGYVRSKNENFNSN